MIFKIKKSSRRVELFLKSALTFFMAVQFDYAYGQEGAEVNQALSTKPSVSKKQAKRKSNKKASIDFEDQLVEGEVKKPELFYLLQKKQLNYKKLIQLRKNFIPEMVKSSEDISILVDEDLELQD